MDNIELSFDLINNSDYDNLSAEVWLDDKKYFDAALLPGRNTVNFKFDEDECDHQLKIVLRGKTEEHTKIDDNDNIIDDVLIDVKNLEIDGIEFDHYLFTSRCSYTHDCNGTEDLQSRDFYGHMGCNGEVTFQFKTPLYVWLLENM